MSDTPKDQTQFGADRGTWLAMIDGLISLLEMLIPQLAGLVGAGLVTPEEQQARLDRIAALRTAGPFTGPEWKKSTDP